MKLAGGLSGTPLLARNDVNVEVEHHLPAGRFVELLNGQPVGGKYRHRRTGDGLGRLHDMRQIVGRDVENGAGRGFGNDQGVARRPRHDVEKRKSLVVLVHLMGRQLAAQDLGEDVGGIVARHRALLEHDPEKLAPRT